MRSRVRGCAWASPRPSCAWEPRRRPRARDSRGWLCWLQCSEAAAARTRRAAHLPLLLAPQPVRCRRRRLCRRCTRCHHRCRRKSRSARRRKGALPAAMHAHLRYAAPPVVPLRASDDALR
eukprot:4863557-Pleurochrysis_carterae.AAC.2